MKIMLFAEASEILDRVGSTEGFGPDVIKLQLKSGFTALLGCLVRELTPVLRALKDQLSLSTKRNRCGSDLERIKKPKASSAIVPWERP